GKRSTLPAPRLSHVSAEVFPPVWHWPYPHLPASLGAPDAVGDHQVEGLPFGLKVQGSSTVEDNTKRLVRGPRIPRLKTKGFLAHFCNLKLQRGSVASA